MSTIGGDPRKHQNCRSVSIVLALVVVALVVVWAFAIGRDQGRQSQFEQCVRYPLMCQNLDRSGR